MYLREWEGGEEKGERVLSRLCVEHGAQSGA